MPYNKTNWQNEPSTATPITAENLNKLETQYDAVVADIDDTSTELGSALSTTFVRFRDTTGNSLPPGSLVTITVDTTTGDIDDITFEEA